METSTAVKRIVCLANSRKQKERCIAGKELLADGRPGGWVRPVSDRGDEAVSSFERQYKDRTEPRVLDVIDVPVLEERPNTYQSENWLLDPHPSHPPVFWNKVCVASLWMTYHSSPTRRGRYGLTDTAATMDGTTESRSTLPIPLIVLCVSSRLTGWNCPRLRHESKLKSAGALPVQSCRDVSGMMEIEFRLSVTDPIYQHAYGERPTSSYALDACFHYRKPRRLHTKGYAYKLIAAIICAFRTNGNGLSH